MKKQLALLAGFSLPGYGAITPPAGIPTGGLDTTGKNLITILFNILMTGGIILSLIFLLIGGIQWITSGGDKNKLEEARNKILYSLIGLIVISLSFFIVSAVLTLLGVNASFFIHINKQISP